MYGRIDPCDMSTTPGKRKNPDADGVLLLADSEYGKDPRDGVWYARPPGMNMGSLENHQVAEHEDGTITVSPSILIQYPNRRKEPKEWHGYLERGVWRQL